MSQDFKDLFQNFQNCSRSLLNINEHVKIYYPNLFIRAVPVRTVVNTVILVSTIIYT